MAAATVTRAFALPNQITMKICVGDLTKSAVGAIVNAANEKMLGGGGVDGAIHRAAGPGLLEACRAVAEVHPGVRCPTGEARLTPGFNLAAANVVHTVGPVYQDDQVSAPLLLAAHRSSLHLASAAGLASIAFPAISCGVYGYPIDKAARISVQSVLDFSVDNPAASQLSGVYFVLFSPEIYTAWVTAAEALIPAENHLKEEEGGGGGNHEL